jgi:hypothetical protein
MLLQWLADRRLHVTAYLHDCLCPVCIGHVCLLHSCVDDCRCVSDCVSLVTGLSCVPAGLTVAEYFRDVEGQDVLLFVDNIFRFTQVRPRSVASAGAAAIVLQCYLCTPSRNCGLWCLL